MKFQGFHESLVKFLGQLKKNNNRSWFERNKLRYESEVRAPPLGFIRAIAPHIEKISPHILVSDSKVAGSMMRPYRDTRFTSGKEPYKHNVGSHFRHEQGPDAHAPGCWMHIEPREFWLAVGMWKPDPVSLQKVRQKIADSPKEWLAARKNPRFRKTWDIVGDTLTRPPRNFDPEHPLIEDIKRKEFLGFRDLGPKELYHPDVVARVSAWYAASKPFMKFLCSALDLDF